MKGIILPEYHFCYAGVLQVYVGTHITAMTVEGVLVC